MHGNALTAGALVAILSLVCCATVHAKGEEWDPPAFAKVDTLRFLTIGPEEGEHWSTVWLVVIDNAVYVRLGKRAAARVRANVRAPYVSVKIGGKEFERVRLVEAPDMKERVAAAMAEKYWSDFIFRRFEHPLTMRLEPDEGDSPHGQ